VLLVVAAVVGGILIGLALGGSFRNLAEARLRWWPLAILGFLLQLIPVPSRPGQLDHWVAVGLLIASYGVLLIFVGANIRLRGFALIAVGFALNAMVIGVNGGMPVKDEALRRAAGSHYEQSRQRLLEKGGLKHHLATGNDVLLPLSDVVGIGGPVGNVFSPGDFLSYGGVAWALAELTRRPRRRDTVAASVTREPGGDPVEVPPDSRPAVGLDRRASGPASQPP
jgi:hypothetical protein